MPGNFLDSNILLYLTTANDRKAVIAKQLLDDSAVISVQVLNEVAHVLSRKYRWSWMDIRIFLETAKGLVTLVNVDPETHRLGLDIAERCGFTVYDSMIAAAAILSDCEFLVTEDLQHGQSINGLVTVINPFI